MRAFILTALGSEQLHDCANRSSVINMNGDHDLDVDLDHFGEQYNEKCGVFGVYVRTLPLHTTHACHAM